MASRHEKVRADRMHDTAPSEPSVLRPLTPQDADACDAIVASLPYHFGDAAGRASCARAVRESPGLVACSAGAVIGFLTWRSWYDAALEITWMAVHADRRRRGVGRSLLRAMVESVPAETRYVVVTTLSPATPEPAQDDTYSGTRRFYEQNGFEPLWEPEGWWNEENQAVLMLCALDPRP